LLLHKCGFDKIEMISIMTPLDHHHSTNIQICGYLHI